MFGRVVHKADFERALAAPARLRSAHFAMHHIPAGQTEAERPRAAAVETKLSTDDALVVSISVDELPPRHWLGCVVPKRHARRAVTRNLLRRQIRAAMDRRVEGLPGGLWVVRLRAPFARQQFPSASSVALRQAARAELDALVDRVAG